MREISFWRWIWGVAVVPAAAWVWLSRGLYPDAAWLGLPLSLVPAYASSLILVGALALAWLEVADLASGARDFIAELLGLRG